MKHLRHGGWLVAACLVAGVATAADERVRNGGFELQDADGKLAGWMPGETIAKRVPNTTAGCRATGSEHYLWDTTSHGDGKGSLRLETLDAYEKAFGIVSTGVGDEQIVLKPETEYRLVFWYRARGLCGFDAQRRDCPLIVDVFFQHGGLFPQPGSKFLSNKRIYIKDDAAEWTKSETVFKTPAGTDWGQVRLQLASTIPDRKATAWFDDVSLQPVAPDAEAKAVATPEKWVARTPVQQASATKEDYALIPPSIPYGTRIQRTMTLLASSTPEHRNTVRILLEYLLDLF